MKFENLEYLGKGMLWELYSSIFSFVLILFSLILIYKHFLFGYFLFFLSSSSILYLYFSWKNRIRKCSVVIDFVKMDLVINVGNLPLVLAIRNFTSFYLDGNYKTATSYLRIIMVNGESYVIRGHYQNSDVLKLYETLQKFSSLGDLQILETIGPNRKGSILLLGGFFVFLTIFPIYLIIDAFFSL